jgi:hypothetical protein
MAGTSAQNRAKMTKFLRQPRFTLRVIRELACQLCDAGYQEERVIVTRERILRVVLVVLGLLFIALIYPLYTDLWHAKWLLVTKNETEPMFLSFFIALGPFLLLAARKPSMHRSLIAFTGWWNLAHASVMTIETVQAWRLGVHRNFADVVITAVIGVVLLALLPPRYENSVAVSA